jgi:hypothetical protein
MPAQKGLQKALIPYATRPAIASLVPMGRCILSLDFPAEIGAMRSNADRQVEAALSSATASK